MVKTLHSAGIEVILDVVYNHTAEGNHFGPTLCFRGIDNASYYRLRARRSALLHGLHRLRQHAQHAASARPADDHGQPAVLDRGDARRRLPLRSRRGAGARAARGRPARRVLRHHSSGSGDLAGEAHRRALGSRRRRLPGRALPGRLDRVERPVSRRGPRLLERRGRPDRRGGVPRLAARATCTSTAAAARTRASISSPRTTGSRCATW